MGVLAEPIAPSTSRWWRFTGYEVVEGSIRPAPAAELVEYDPWEDYLSARGRGVDRVPPYQSLLRLTEGLTTEELKLLFSGEAVPVELGDKREKELLRWCSRHGLLGIVPHLYSALRLPIAVVAARWHSNGAESWKVLFDLTVFQRTHDGWITRPMRFEAGGDEAVRVAESLLASSRLVPVDIGENAGDFAPSGADMFRGQLSPEELREFVHHTEVLDETWKDLRAESWLSGPHRVLRGAVNVTELLDDFFPNLEGDRPARPLSPDFWATYAEPVSLFMHWAVRLKLAIETLRGNERAGLWSALVGRPLEPDFGRLVLDRLLEPISPVIEERGPGEGYRLGWSTPSLLAGLGMMITLDLVEGRRVHVCEACSTVFLSRAYQVKFCSDRCANRIRMRRRRERERQSQEERSAGKEERR